MSGSGADFFLVLFTCWRRAKFSAIPERGKDYIQEKAKTRIVVWRMGYAVRLLLDIAGFCFGIREIGADFLEFVYGRRRASTVGCHLEFRRDSRLTFSRESPPGFKHPRIHQARFYALRRSLWLPSQPRRPGGPDSRDILGVIHA